MKKRWTLLDSVLILLLCICLLSIPFRFMRGEKKEELREIHLTAVVRNVHEQTLATLAVGDLLYNDAGEPFGQIVGIQSEPTKKSFLKNGEYREETLDALFLKDVYLELAFLGSCRENVFFREGKYAVLSGATCKLYTQKSAWPLLVLDVFVLE